MHSYAEAARVITAADSVAVIGHVRPDADAIGSVGATVLALRQLGKQATGLIGQADAFAENLLTIPGAGEIGLVDKLPDVDLIITVDCGSIDRTGRLAGAIAADAGREAEAIPDPGAGGDATDRRDVEKQSAAVVGVNEAEAPLVVPDCQVTCLPCHRRGIHCCPRRRSGRQR